jgi:hypothetical protein
MQSLLLESCAECAIHPITTHPKKLKCLELCIDSLGSIDNVGMEDPNYLGVTKRMGVALGCQVHHIGMSPRIQAILTEPYVVCCVIDPQNFVCVYAVILDRQPIALAARELVPVTCPPWVRKSAQKVLLQFRYKILSTVSIRNE